MRIETIGSKAPTPLLFLLGTLVGAGSLEPDLTPVWVDASSDKTCDRRSCSRLQVTRRRGSNMVRNLDYPSGLFVDDALNALENSETPVLAERCHLDIEIQTLVALLGIQRVHDLVFDRTRTSSPGCRLSVALGVLSAANPHSRG